MPSFGRQSQRRLSTCHPDLVLVLQEAIKFTDFSVLCGHRGRKAQEKAFDEGKSKTPWPFSCHNVNPSRAVDIAPWPIDYDETTEALARWYYVAGVIVASAKNLGIELRWGGNWQGDDHNWYDNQFDDLGHFELGS